jgi:hypothetical protein
MMPKPIESTSTVMKINARAPLPALGKLIGSFLREALSYYARC